MGDEADQQSAEPKEEPVKRNNPTIERFFSINRYMEKYYTPYAEMIRDNLNWLTFEFIWFNVVFGLPMAIMYWGVFWRTLEDEWWMQFWLFVIAVPWLAFCLYGWTQNGYSMKDLTLNLWHGRW